MLRDDFDARRAGAESGKHALNHAFPFQFCEMIGQTTVGGGRVS